MSEWQPIEKAPKDRPILVCQSRNGIIKIARGTKYGDWSAGPSTMDYIAGVTHWMPLPKPPSEAT